MTYGSTVYWKCVFIWPKYLEVLLLQWSLLVLIFGEFQIIILNINFSEIIPLFVARRRKIEKRKL